MILATTLLLGLATVSAWLAFCCGLDYADALRRRLGNIHAGPVLPHAARCCAFGLLSCLSAVAAWSTIPPAL